MSQEQVREEIAWQIDGIESQAYVDPRWFTYRVLTVLGLELTLDTVNKLEEEVAQQVAYFEDFDGYDDDTDGHGFFPDDIGYYDTMTGDVVPWKTEAPLTDEEETELLAQFPDGDRA
jgi:hypothetical protein